MPKLSLYRPNKTSDYKFLDNTIREMYTAGGLDLHIHKYLGPKTVGDSATREGSEGTDATRPTYDESNPLFIEDVLFLENMFNECCNNCSVNSMSRIQRRQSCRVGRK